MIIDGLQKENNILNDSKKYSENFENEIYNKVVNFLDKNYSSFLKRKNIFNILKEKGNIYYNKNINSKCCYDYKTKNIYLNYIATELDKNLLHECIHKLGNKNKNIVGLLKLNNAEDNGLGNSLNEGATEYIIHSVYENEKNNFLFGDGKKLIYMPYTISSEYMHQYAIIRLMNKKLKSISLYESVLKGKDNFQKEFIKKYGVNNFNYIKNNSEKILESNDKNEKNKLLYDTQEKLIKNCFNIDYNKINFTIKKVKILKDLNYIKKYLIRDQKVFLKGEKDWFDFYYEEMFNRIKKDFINHHLDIKILDKYKYKNEINTKEKNYLLLKNLLKNQIIFNKNKKIKNLNLKEDDLKNLYEIKNNDNTYNYFLKNNKVILIKNNSLLIIKNKNEFELEKYNIEKINLENEIEDKNIGEEKNKNEEKISKNKIRKFFNFITKFFKKEKAEETKSELKNKEENFLENYRIKTNFEKNKAIKNHNIKNIEIEKSER